MDEATWANGCATRLSAMTATPQGTGTVSPQEMSLVQQAGFQKASCRWTSRSCSHLNIHSCANSLPLGRAGKGSSFLGLKPPDPTAPHLNGISKHFETAKGRNLGERNLF